MTPVGERLAEVRDEILDWCRERSAVARLPLLAWMSWIGFRHLADGDYQSWFKPLTLGIHEGGHLLFGWLGLDFLTVAGGTLLQLAAPAAAAFMFARQPDWFAVSVAGTWLADSVYDVALYMADARELDLPLVTVGDGECFDVCHDWHYMLRETGLLAWDTTLAGLLRLGACALLWASVAAGAWMLWRMTRDDGTRAA
jgi:hypothetical protein